MDEPTIDDLKLADDLEALGLVRLASRMREARSHAEAMSVQAFARELLSDNGTPPAWLSSS